MVVLILTMVALLSAVMCIRAKYAGPKIYLYIFKSLASIVILAIALYVGHENTSLYKYFIATGLFFCLLGDIFLMFPGKLFIHGVLSFLISHLLFISAFIGSANLSVSWWLEVIFITIAILAIKLLFPFLENNMKLPIIVYIVVIATMSCLGWERYFTLKNTLPLFAAIGALFFLVSDLLLALNRFRKRFKSAEIFILSTYYISIWLIALSVR